MIIRGFNRAFQIRLPLMNWLFTLLLLISIPSSLQAEPIRLTRMYHIYWTGLLLGEMIGEYQYSQDTHSFKVIMRSDGLGAKLANYHNESQASWNQLLPGQALLKAEKFELFSKFRRKSRNVLLHYDANGRLTLDRHHPEIASKKYPIASPAQKKDSQDPLTAALNVQRLARQYQKASHIPLYHELKVYEGRKLFTLCVTINARKTITVSDQAYETLYVRLHRKPIAGFSKSELYRLKHEDPVIEVYLSDDALLLPVKAVATAKIGSVVALLKKECATLTACLKK